MSRRTPFEFQFDAGRWLDSTAMNALRRNHLTDLDVLAAETFDDLIAIRNIGVYRVQAIAAMLKHYGYGDATWIRELKAHMATHATLPKYGR